MANTAGTIESWQKYDITVNRWVYGGDAQGGYPDTNNFGSDPTCICAWLFEDGVDFMADSIGNNDLTEIDPTNMFTADTISYIEGISSLNIVRQTGSNVPNIFINDADLDNGFPHKSTTSDKDFSLTFWFKLTQFPSTNNWSSIYYKARSSMVDYTTLVDVGNLSSLNRLRFSFYDDSHVYKYIRHDSDLSLDRWYHVGITYSVDTAGGAARIRIWDNTAQAILGVDKTGIVGIMGAHGTDPVRIAMTTLYDGIELLYGKLDEMTVWNRVLSTDEIDQIRNGVFGT